MVFRGLFARSATTVTRRPVVLAASKQRFEAVAPRRPVAVPGPPPGHGVCDGSGDEIEFR